LRFFTIRLDKDWINTIYIYIMHIRNRKRKFSRRTPSNDPNRARCRESRHAAAILRRQSVRSNRKIPRFAILQSAWNRTFLRVISNAISSRVYPEEREGEQVDGGSRTTEGSWLASDNALLCIPLP